MIELVNALLLLTREESSTNAEPISLAGAIKDALDPSSGVLTTKGIAIVIDIGGALRVKANRSAPAIALSNLIDNAIRHTERGHIRFSYVDGWLRIEDTGRGIPEHDLLHMVERFYQASPASETGRTPVRDNHNNYRLSGDRTNAGNPHSAGLFRTTKGLVLAGVCGRVPSMSMLMATISSALQTFVSIS